jgi:Family of unknown function (DUF6194)
MDDIIRFATGLPGVVAFTPDEMSGAPEVAWGDTFFFYDPDDDPAARRMPFATIVTKDYPDWDTASNLSRPGVSRLNIAVGRAAVEELAGDSGDVDYTEIDRLIPHPVYATQGWVAIVNPGERTGDLARKLLADAHARAARRHRR